MKIFNANPVAVVINTGDSNGYGVIRNLGRKGIPVISVDSDSANITFFSRYAVRRKCPDIEDSEEKFIDFLLNLGCHFNPKPVLFVTGDIELLAVLKHRDQLQSSYYLPPTELDIAEKLVNKKQFYKMLDELGIPHATTYFPKGLLDIERMSQDIPYPCIIKPTNSRSFRKKFQVKCFKASSDEELIELYKRVTSQREDVIIQKEISGNERYLVYTYFNRNSKPLAVCCYRKIRLLPIDYGNACLCETIWNPEVAGFALDALRKIGYRGLAEPEIQRDLEDGELKLIEINPRSTTETRLSARCGMNMEYIAYCDILGRPITKNNLQKQRIKWLDVTRDFYAVFYPNGYLAKGKLTIKDWWKSLRGEKGYAIFAQDDPLPFIVSLLKFFLEYGLKLKNYVKILSLLWRKN